MMAVIKKLKLFICNDTGVMHIAAALGIPVIAVFGPGEKETIGPYGPEHVIVRKESVKCRPCWDYCRYKLPHCILDISADQVMQKVEEKLRE
jgi:ADP-heptose:LPS heptosyltransferase